MVVEITMQRTQRIVSKFDVIEEEIELLKMGINPFQEEMENEIGSGDADFDYAVCNENGETIVDWM